MQNAYIVSGEEKYKEWLLEYVGGWMERAEAAGGLLPDNVGLGGIVGEEMDGRWYGASYGWSWPHGFYNIAMASLLAGVSCFQLTGDSKYLELPRTQIDMVMALGKTEALDLSQMSLAEHWIPQMSALAGKTIADPQQGSANATREMMVGTRLEEYAAAAGNSVVTPTFVVPYRHADSGWFDYQPMSAMYPAMLWNVCGDPRDKATLDSLRDKEAYDWSGVYSFRTKEDAGHEPPWLCFLAGENDSFPAEMLKASLSQVYRRSEQIRQDQTVGSDGRYDRAMPARGHDIHHWQMLNPVTTESLIQLMLGGPQLLYNGGLLLAPLRYFDGDAKRPGLPADVAALVSKVSQASLSLTLVNLSAVAARTVIVQAGTLREHTFTTVQYSALASPYPAAVGDYAAPDVVETTASTTVDGGSFTVSLPPGTQVNLVTRIRRNVSAPTYAFPF